MHFFKMARAHGFINIQPADSTVGCSEIILMAARNIRVFDGRIHVGVEMTELLVPNNLENIVNYFKLSFI